MLNTITWMFCRLYGAHWEWPECLVNLWKKINHYLLLMLQKIWESLQSYSTVSVIGRTGKMAFLQSNKKYGGHQQSSGVSGSVLKEF